MKKVLTYLLSMVMVAALAISGTVAYLQHEDSDVNVMTLGNVKIEQHEYERELNADGTFKTATIDNQTSYVLKDFTQAKPLYPIVGDPSKAGDDPMYAGWDTTTVRMTQKDSYGGMQVFAGKNAQDKFVTVENTGKSDAYVRTIVAIEVGTGNAELIGTSYHSTWEKNIVGIVEIEGNNYYVLVFDYKGADNVRHENGVLPAGDTTYPNLSQVYLKSEATNEDCEALDGNKNGTLDIFVLSQAVQTAGFNNALTALDTAFGDTNEENVVSWFGDLEIQTVINNYNDTKNLRGYVGSAVVGKDFVSENIIHFGENSDVNVDLNGKTIIAENRGQYLLGAQKGAILTLGGEGTIDAGKGFYANKGNSEIIINGGTYKTSQTGTLDGIKHHSLAQNNSKIVINDGTFISTVDNACLFFATSNAVIEVNGGFFENIADSTPDLFSMGTNASSTNRIIFKGGTFVNWNPLEDRMCYTGEADYSTLGGPWMIVWDGYTVKAETQSNGDIWYSVVQK